MFHKTDKKKKKTRSVSVCIFLNGVTEFHDHKIINCSHNKIVILFKLNASRLSI